MNKKRKSFRAAACIITLAALLTGCGAGTAGIDSIVTENASDAENGNDAVISISLGNGSDAEKIYQLSTADLNTESGDAVDIEFDGEDIYPITEGGTYRITGNQSGQIHIDVNDEIVHLIVENAYLHTYAGPAVYVESAAKVVITVPDGTRSAISDSTDYTDYQNARACIFSNSDLTLNGAGKLVVTAYYKDAIRSKDTLKILDTDLEIKAKKNGLRGNDAVIVENAKIDLQCEGNGIYTKEDKKDGKGYVSVKDTGMTVIAGRYGIRSAKDIYLAGSAVDIYGVMGDYYCMGEIFGRED